MTIDLTAFDFTEFADSPKPANAKTPTDFWIDVDVIGQYTDPARNGLVVGFRVRSLTTRMEWDAVARDVRGRRS